MAFCWECWQRGIRDASLRGSTGGKGTEYYRCSTLHDQYKFRGKPDPEMLANLLPAAGLSSSQPLELPDFLSAHHALRADQLTRQVDDLVARLRIPEDWHDAIAAYRLNADGMARVERERYNLTQETNRLRDLYRLGHLSLADFQAQSLAIQGYLAGLRPSASPAGREVVELPQDFPALWARFSPLGRRTVLQIIFAGLYFDGEGTLRWAQAHSPFDRLIDRS